jgi:hypothetical protein
MVPHLLHRYLSDRPDVPVIEEITGRALPYAAETRSRDELRRFLEDLGVVTDLNVADLWWRARTHGAFLHASRSGTWRYRGRPSFVAAAAGPMPPGRGYLVRQGLGELNQGRLLSACREAIDPAQMVSRNRTSAPSTDAYVVLEELPVWPTWGGSSATQRRAGEAGHAQVAWWNARSTAAAARRRGPPRALRSAGPGSSGRRLRSGKASGCPRPRRSNRRARE